MAARRLLGCLPVAALALYAGTACNDKGEGAQVSVAELEQRCERLGKVCADKGKHVEKVIDECKQAAKTQVENGCAAKVIAVYDCYEKEVCGNGDKVWTIEDLRVLAERHNTCVAERAASNACAKP